MDFEFGQLADQWWDPNGPLQVLHAMNECRFQYLNSHASVWKQSVLDLGCGGGLLSEVLRRQGAEVIGVDQDAHLIKVAQEHARDQQLLIDYRVQEAISFCEGQLERFQLITCMELMEHVQDPPALIQAMAAGLKPGGHLFLSTLNRTAWSFCVAIVGAEYILRLLPKGTHQYQAFIKPIELEHWLRSAGLKIKDIRGIEYNPFTKKARLSSNVKVNYIVCAQK